MDKETISAVTSKQMIEIDRLMIEEYGITLLQMMENAGRNMADLCKNYLGGNLSGSKILAACGGGNNGGGGMAAARHLLNRGADVMVAFISNIQSLKNAPQHQMNSLEQMEVEIVNHFPEKNYDIIIDALIGYGLRGSPEGMASQWIRWINDQNSQIISLDVPSGLDADAGIPHGDCICADATLTLALPKVGMIKDEARKYTGELYLADISVPISIIRRFFPDSENIFVNEAIIKL